VLSGRGLCNGLITCQRSPTKFGVSECDCEDSIMRRPCCAMEGDIGWFECVWAITATGGKRGYICHSPV
jgi:hypothetical protein